jgi:hypothetical protein
MQGGAQICTPPRVLYQKPPQALSQIATARSIFKAGRHAEIHNTRDCSSLFRVESCHDGSCKGAANTLGACFACGAAGDRC